MSRRPARLTAALLGASLWLACAVEQAPINRVQPNFYDKSFFVGADYQGTQDDPEFYSQGTLVDVGYGAGQDGLFTSTYAQPLTRVKWTVTEDLLIARLAYERVAGADGKGAGKLTNDGIVVAAFKVQSHFDIKRQYNPSTGEQLNVIEENTVDRPWFQRQYLRVDWSKNLSTDNYDFDTLSQLGVYGGIVYEPLAYTVNDPASEDAPHVDLAAGYLDVTNKAFARPQMVDVSMFGMGLLPACWFDADFSGGTAPATGCAPVELTIRQSFLKVKDTDYEPEDWDGLRFQSFGAFTTERFGYARDYGMTDTQWHRFINRYNLWERSHVYAEPLAMTGPTACYTPQTTPVGVDPHRDVNGDGTEDECASVGRGSRCDTFKQRCTLPYRDRKERPLAWYYSEGSNPLFFEATRDATHEWDVALRAAVMTARYAECVRTADSDCAAKFPVYTGGQEDNQDAIALAKEVDDCRAGRAYGGVNCEAVADTVGRDRGVPAGVIALAKLPEMLVLCHSPVEAGDPAQCGGPRLPADLSAHRCFQARQNGEKELFEACQAALTVRMGDLRYHHVNTMVAPQTPSPWGIMVDSNDPLTGEVVAASINVWSHVTDLWSQGVVDTARYIKGELSTADVTEGTYVRDWASAAEAASRNGSLPLMTKDERNQLLGRMLGHQDPTQLTAQLEQFKKGALYRQASRLSRELKAVKADAFAVTTSAPVYEARRKKAFDTMTEAALTTRMMQSYVGGAGKLDSATMAELASPLRGANPTVQRSIRNARELALAERGACVLHEAPAPLAIANLATILEEKFGAFDKQATRTVQHERAERMRRWVADRAHYAVVTHEMGHSIGLRHNFVSSSDAFNYRPQYWQLRTDNGANSTPCGAVEPTGGCVGPRYLDPLNENERRNLIGMFMQSSTMDYAGEATQDLLGLGAYDFAATRMFYGDVAAVFADASYNVGGDRAMGTLDKLDGFGGILGITYSVGDGAGDTRDIHYSALQQEFQLINGCAEVNPQAWKPATWSDATMGTWHPVVDGLIVPVGGKYSKCRSQPVDYVGWRQLRSAGGSAHGADGQSRPRFPYGFATDRWADLGNLSVYRHDNGADPYELFDFLITQQEVNHIFDNYRRNRQTFSVRGAANRTLYRYNEKLRDAAKGMGLIANIYRDFAVAQGYDYDSLWPYLGTELFGENLLASGLGFDHFARQLARPEAGPHSLEGTGPNRLLRSNVDAPGNEGRVAVVVPNGATGYFGNVAFGGRPMENALASDKGEYDSEYTINAGSYYDKAWSAMLMTESVDNFISDSRRDFLDARYRSVSMADLFPEGYRRWLGNNLTGDEWLKGARVEAGASGSPLQDNLGFPTKGLGYVSWWRGDAQACFQADSTLQCSSAPSASVPVDPQVGWEQQKFLIALTLLYLPENQQQQWLNMMGIWELGADTDPGFPNRIELHLPHGKVYIAKTFGKETVLGKSVQKGIGARMLQWGNELLQKAYDVENGPDLDGDGAADWVRPRLVNGRPAIKYDPTVKTVTPAGGLVSGRPGCDATDNSQCTCSSNKACLELSRYEEVPFFMRQAMRDYGLADPSMKGIY